MLELLAVVCPPLAVLIATGPLAALKNALLTLCGFVPGVLHARAAVERRAAARQYGVLMRLLDDREARAPRTQAA